MASRSSISSSESSEPQAPAGRAWPWAALCAAVCIAVLDAVALDCAAPWEWLRDHVTADGQFARPIPVDRIALATLRADPREDRPLVFVVGSSRVQEGFQPQRIQKRGRHELYFVRMAHALLSPVEIRSIVPHLIPHDPALVVIGLSEFDTHGMLRLLPGASYHSLGALIDVAEASSLRALFRRRHELYRVTLAGALRLYHFREVLRAVGLDRLRTFSPPRGSAAGVADDEPVPAELEAVVRHFDARHPERGADVHPAQARLAWQVRRGPDADVHKALLRSAIRELREAEIPVLVVELPLFPGLERAYDASTRVDFRDFVRELEDEYGVHFVPLGAQPPYEEADFEDPIHLGIGGSIKLTRVVMVSSMRVLHGSASR